MPTEASDPVVVPLRGSSLMRAASAGALWLLGQTAASRAIQLLSQIALAWLLTPGDFGEVSLALAVSTMISAFFNVGLEDVLLQRHRTMRLWTGTVFWLTLAIGVLAGAILLIAAPIAALVYREPNLAGLIAVAALGAPIASLETVPGTLIRARLDFRAFALAALGEALCFALLSIILAALGCGPYSLILPSPLAAAGRVFILWRVARPSIGGPRSLRRWKYLMPSASGSLGGRLLIILMGPASYMILGFFASTAEVGLYYFAFRLAIQPLRLLAGSLGAVLFPALVQYRDDLSRQLDAALLASQMLSVVVMPLCFLQAALAGPVLHLFFSAQWHSAEPLIQLLSLGFAFDASSWAAGSLLIARGEFQRGFRYTLVETPIFLFLVALGAVSLGGLGTAAGVAAYYLLVQPVFCYFVFTRAGAVDWRQVARIFAGPVIVGGAAVATTWLIVTSVDRSAWVQLFAVAAVALPIYVALIRIFCPKPYRLLRDRVLHLGLGSNAL